MRAFMNRFRRDTRGAVAVEFVLIAPMLLALMFGTATLGFFVGISHSVQELAAGAARASVAGIDATERQAFAAAYLNEGSQRYPLLAAEALTTSVTVGDDAITVDVSYATEGGFLDIANGFLGLGIGTIEGGAYVAY